MRLSQRSTRAGQFVQVEEKRFGYFPKTFRWRGKSYNVDAVERCWNARRYAPSLCFRVRVGEGMYDLYQNVRDNTWRLVPLQA